MTQPPTPYRCRLAVFDLDGTLKQERSPYGYVHRTLGVAEEAAAIYDRYRRGELTYGQWGREEIALWRGLPVARLREIISQIPYWPGAFELVQALRAAGVRVALLSAGFDVHVRHWAAELGVDDAYYNRLLIADGRLAGDLETTVNGHNKGALVRELQQRYGVGPAETLVAGDTIWDIPMFAEAAVSIAVAPADPAVAAAADLVLPDGDWRPAAAQIEALRPGWWPPPAR